MNTCARLYRAVELDEQNAAHHSSHVAYGVVGSQHPSVIVHPKIGPSYWEE